MITFTLDLEDHRSNYKDEKRYPDITRQILSLLDENSTKGTFFVVGNIAKEEPVLIKDIVNRGHELAFHSLKHKELQNENPAKFRQETITGKKLLEDVSGQEVIGYRAPVFSLTKHTMWALDILYDVGFIYSSSVLPAFNPLNGFSGAPKKPFYWPNGLLEIPVPVINAGPVTIPYLGGVYLRYLPMIVIKRLINMHQEQHLWMYCHPYDFDPNESFFRIKDASLLTSLILWFNRGSMKKKISCLLALNEYKSRNMTFSTQVKAGLFKNSSRFILES